MPPPTKPAGPALAAGPLPPAPRKDGYDGRTSSLSQPALTGVGRGPAASKATEMAPEASQGPWRERAFIPRGVMSRADIAETLEVALVGVLASSQPLPALQAALREAWMPVLRQAAEQGAGDGLDGWLTQLLKPTGRPPSDVLWKALVAGLASLRDVPDKAGLEQTARALAAVIDQALGVPRPRRLSFKLLERELEGKLEVDELLAIAAGPSELLQKRLAELEQTMEQLREQIRTRPGVRPDALYSNFTRLKAETRVLAAELKRRG